MRIVLTGGGTGGHIYPALAFWRYTVRCHPQAQVLYIGGERGLERDIVSREGLPFTTVEAAPLKRQVSPAALRTALTTYRGYRQAKRMLREFQPDLVLGTGGYVTLPVVFAAQSLRIPTVIWEGNVRPGLTNQLCARRASAVAVSFPGSEQFFPNAARVVCTGNPRASEVLGADPERMAAARQAYGIDANRRLIVCFAGSRGAETVNDVLVQLLPRFAEVPDWQLLYVTGPGHFDDIRARAGQIPPNVVMVPFVHDMPAVLPQADVAVTRAGSSTLAEICALGVPSILIPSPYVTANHQEHNALRLVEQGAAYMLRESELTPESLWNALHTILDTGRAVVMRDAAKRCGTPDAVRALYELAMSVRKK